ncbi:MAG: glycosyltransferase family 39 protein [Adhaeribacter sp.]
MKVTLPQTTRPLPPPDQVGLHNRVLIPLSVILLVALLIRVLAALFSRGYAFNDDHFDVTAIAQHWVEGVPDWLHEDMPPRHSMFYAGLHYVLFYLCELAGLRHPEGKMVLVRLLHGLYSLLTVYYGYKITCLLSGQREARLVGLMLALMWFMPFMSVRNLVEMVCIPPCLAAFYLLLKAPERRGSLLLAGGLFGLAFVLRYQSLLLAAGMVGVLAYRRQWGELAWWLAGFGLVVSLVQGSIDLFFFDYPFHSVVTYFRFNLVHAREYTSGPVYRYLFTVLGFLVPPVSVFLLAGCARTARQAPMLFGGALVFFLLHTLFPNKQERFILPLLPLVIILGVVGWQRWVPNSAFWQRRRKLLAWSWGFFWILNLAAALALSFTYTKKSRVAPWVYLSSQAPLRGVVLETGNRGPKLPPLFYLGHPAAQVEDFLRDEKRRWGSYKSSPPADLVLVYSLEDAKPLDTLQAQILPAYAPDYVVMVGPQDLNQRLQRLRRLFPHLRLVYTIPPSSYDQLLHKLNPRHHSNEQVQIYRIGRRS